MSNKQDRDAFLKEVGRKFIAKHEPAFDDTETILLMHLHIYFEYRAGGGAIGILKEAKKKLDGMDFAQLVFFMSDCPIAKYGINVEAWYNVVHHYWDNKIEGNE